jgi:hypothetical protein
VFGANADPKTHLLVEALNQMKVHTVFVGRVSAYPFETLMQVSLRASLHYPVCFAEVSHGAGTALEVHSLVAAGNLIAAFAPEGRLATQFLRDLASCGAGFRLFQYSWSEADEEPTASHVASLLEAVKVALEWSKEATATRSAALDRAYPWRVYERLPPSEAIKYPGECSCYSNGA